MGLVLPTQYQGAGASIPWVLSFAWATTVASPTAVTVYKNGTDTSATNMPSGSHSVSGTNLTLKPLTALIGGELYIVDVIITVDGVPDEFWLPVQALKSTTGKT
jgi:hypothetical protein